jgi:hypothetical protein
MNTPARFESLLWMASPMAAWAQASALPTTPMPASPHKRAPAQAGTGAKSRRKRGKSPA